MAKRKKQETRPLDVAAQGGLVHSPFAGLAGKTAPADSPPPTTAPDATRAVTRTEALVFSAKVVVRREKKGRAGKVVTRVTGIGEAHRRDLSSQMKKALGCGAILEGADVVLLGSLVDAAVAWLEKAGAPRVVRD